MDCFAYRHPALLKLFSLTVIPLSHLTTPAQVPVPARTPISSDLTNASVIITSTPYISETRKRSRCCGRLGKASSAFIPVSRGLFGGDCAGWQVCCGWYSMFVIILLEHIFYYVGYHAFRRKATCLLLKIINMDSTARVILSLARGNLWLAGFTFDCHPH